jgi:hypothetical protein
VLRTVRFFASHGDFHVARIPNVVARSAIQGLIAERSATIPNDLFGCGFAAMST